MRILSTGSLHFRQRISLLAGLLLFFLPWPMGHAAAVVQRTQQQRAQQEAIVRQQYEMMMAQRQAMYQQAVQQAQAQQVAAYRKAAAEQAAYKQAMQQAVAQRQAAVVQEAQARQAVAQYQAAQVQKLRHDMAEAQVLNAQRSAQINAEQQINAQLNEYATYMALQQQAIASKVQGDVAQQMITQTVAKKAVADQVQNQRVAQKVQQQMVGARVAQTVAAKKAYDHYQEMEEERGSEEEQGSRRVTVVNIEDLWAALDQASRPWRKIIDREVKVLTVSEYIDRFVGNKVLIRKTPGHYVDMIDGILEQSPPLREAPFLNVLGYAAVMEYDFDNGQNKDELARQMLGEANFEANKRRILGR
ncbi:MAG: hypothetical protein GX606_01325 [Elusimicrobia bacterium]|nr:hypothetical protein [Elusimicrobiota bacterium]